MFCLLLGKNILNGKHVFLDNETVIFVRKKNYFPTKCGRYTNLNETNNLCFVCLGKKQKHNVEHKTNDSA